MKKTILLITLFFSTYSLFSQKDTVIVSKNTELYKTNSLFSPMILDLKRGDTLILNEINDNKFYHCTHLKSNSEGYVLIKYISTNTSIDLTINTAGDELIKFKNRMYGGKIISFIGGGIILSNYNDETTRKVGAGIAIVGLLMQLESYSHVGKAGEILNKQKLK